MKGWMLAIFFTAISGAGLSSAQVSLVVGGAKQLVEQIGARGGKTAASELLKLGGEQAVREVLEKAAKQGGDALVEKLSRYSIEFGPTVLRAAKESPLKFVEAFERLPAQLRVGALQEIRREPEMMQKLISEYGDTALSAAARHPGVGPTVLSKIGRESSDLLATQPTDQVIRVARLADGIGRAPVAERKELLLMIKRAPEKTLNLLESNPNVLKTAGVLTAFLVAKDQILGDSQVIIGPDGKPVVLRKPGIIEVVTEQVSDLLAKPLLIVAIAFGLILVFGAMGYIWQLRRRR